MVVHSSSLENLLAATWLQLQSADGISGERSEPYSIARPIFDGNGEVGWDVAKDWAEDWNVGQWLRKPEWTS